MSAAERTVSSLTDQRQLLLVDDDLRIANDLIEDLARYRFAVTHAATAVEATLLIKNNHYDVMIVDRVMPGMGGLTFIAQLRKEMIMTPVLVLSGLNKMEDRVSGLHAGGDDYLAKPYAMAELVARLEALLRRPAAARVTMLTAGPLRIDLMEHSVTRNGRPVDLLAREFRLLEYMVRSAGLVLTREMLLEDVWNYRSQANSNLVEVHMSKLRRKIDPPGETPLIVSIRGAGYMFRVPE